MLRSMMLVDRVAPLRNARYLSDKTQILTSDVNDKEKNRLIEQLTKQTFHLEMEAVSQYTAMRAQVEDMLKQQRAAENLGRKMPRRFMEKFSKMEQIASLPLEAFVAQTLLQAPAIRQFKKQYPEIDKQLKMQIREAVRRNNDLQVLHPCARHLPATVDVFKEQYPLVAQQLEKQVQSPPAEMPFIASISAVALGLLKTKSESAFQDPKLNSRAFGAISMTETFAPMIRRINYGITQILSSVSLKPAVKKLFASTPMKRLQHVAMGVGLSLTLLSGVQGLLPSSEQPELAQQMMQLAEHVTQEDRRKLSLMGSAHVPGVEHAPDPETTVLFSPALTGEGMGPEIPAYDGGVVYEQVHEDFVSEQPSAYGGSYQIKAGDTLSEIIEAQLEYAQVAYSYAQVMELTELTAEVNGIDNPDVIRAGDTLTLLQMPGNETIEQLMPDPEFISDIDDPLPEQTPAHIVGSPSLSLRVR